MLQYDRVQGSDSGEARDGVLQYDRVQGSKRYVSK